MPDPSMDRRSLQTFGTIVVLAVAIGGGWASTNLFQRTVPIVPGLQGCWRLEGTARQDDCVVREFKGGIAEVTASKSGDQRDAAVLEYVRRTERIAASDPNLASSCHSAMHVIGRSEGSRASRAGNVPVFPRASSQLCTAGYVHGLAEGYLGAATQIDIAAIYPKLCHDRAAEEGCAHGIGHALLQAQPSSAVSSVGPALSDCSELPAGVELSCHNGVYMELAMRRQPRVTPVEDFTKICRGAPAADMELACWTYLGITLQTNDVPVSKLPAACSRASLPAQFPCIETYGRQLGVGRVASCEVVDRASLRRRCVTGAIGLQVGSGHVSTAEANSGCASIGSDSLERYCKDAVVRYSAGRAKLEKSI